MTTPYTQGTVSVTAGSTTVTGTGTGWLTSGIVPGVLGVDGLSGPVATIVSDTELTMAVPWAGPSASGKSYWLTYDTSNGQQTILNTQRLAEYLARLDKPTLAALAALTPAANKLPYFASGNTGALADFPASARSLLGLSGASNKLPYMNGANGYATTDLTAKARDFLGAADIAGMRTVIGAGTGDGNGDVTGPAGGVTAKQVAGFSSTAGKAIVGLTATEVRAAGLVPVGQFRNKIINPLFSVNQRSVSGTVTLAAGAYGHDRMKAGSGGCTYTFGTNNGVTVLNITAGSIQQVIERSFFAGEPGAYFLSWSGTSQGRFAGGSYGVSGSVSAGIDAAGDVAVEFGVGTLSLVQLEKDYVTPFSSRGETYEALLCRRYFEAASFYVDWYGTAGAPMTYNVMFLAIKRSVPTLSYTTSVSNNIATIYVDIPTPNKLRIGGNPASTGPCALSISYTANSEL